MKRILYFMPDNPLQKNAGNKTRAFQLLQYFSSRKQHVKVDYVSEKHWGSWDDAAERSFEVQFPDVSLMILNRKPERKRKIAYLLFKLADYVLKYKWLLFKPQIPDRNTFMLQKQFNKLLEKEQYDTIIISYVEWATLIANNPKIGEARLIVDTHDFITAQQKNGRSFKLGRAFEREIELISMFHETWLLSSDEHFIFSQFAEGTLHRFVPLMFRNNAPADSLSVKKRYDIIYVASENHHNVNSAKWFFTEVYPMLERSVQICVIGKVCQFIPDLENVDKHLFVDDLSVFYHQSKLSICPMLSGTGVKVKTVEALSYGLPVVSTYRGLDGLPIKQDNGCFLANDPHEFAEHVKTLLADQTLYNTAAKNATAFMNTYFELSSVHKKLDKFLNLE